jgi:hypothetical protein
MMTWTPSAGYMVFDIGINLYNLGYVAALAVFGVYIVRLLFVFLIDLRAQSLEARHGRRG